jgi:hypothetical protein
VYRAHGHQTETVLAFSGTGGIWKWSAQGGGQPTPLFQTVAK